MKKPMTVSEAGLAGAKATRKKYGKEHYSKMGKLSAKKRKKEAVEKGTCNSN